MLPTLGPTGSFLARLFPPALALGGYVSLWDRQTRGSVHVPAMDLAAVEVEAAKIDGKQHDAYFGVALRAKKLDSAHRGGRADTCVIPGFWADVDFRSQYHAAENLPEPIAALELLDSFPLKLTDLILSGYGYQAWWLLDKPHVYSPSDSVGVQAIAKAFQAKLIEHFVVKGYHVDVTSDLARVLRAPGSHNWKDPANPQPVRGVIHDPHRFTYKELDLRPRFVQSLSEFDDTAPVKPTPYGLSPTEHVKFILSNAKKRETKTLFNKIIKGESFGVEGYRDINLQKAASAIAFVDYQTPATQLAEILRPSLEAIAREATNTKNPPPTFEQAVDKIARAQQDKRRDVASDKDLIDSFAERGRLLGGLRTEEAVEVKIRPSPDDDRGSRGDVTAATSSEGSGSSMGEGLLLDDRPLSEILKEKQKVRTNGVELNGSAALLNGSSHLDERQQRSGFYTEEELEIFAQINGCKSFNDLKIQWVIQSKERYFVLVNGIYQKPIFKVELEHSLPRDLAPLGSHISFQKMLQSGEMRDKKADELIKGYTTVAREYCADLTIEFSKYDPTKQKFHEAVCRVRPELKAVFHEQIHEWLMKLGGQHHEKLFDWIATITQLDKQTCALVLSGAPGTGKTMLAVGLGRIWTTGSPTELDRIMENFNADLLRCPLIFADEILPEGRGTSAKLRRMIGTSERVLSKKFVDNFDLVGAIRLILCSNNDTMLQFDDELSAYDQNALAERFLHLEVDEDARDYLRSIGGRQGTDGWVSGDMIAEHALWLIETREVVPASRFLVEGFRSKMHTDMSINNRNTSLVCEWIVRHMLNPGGLDTKAVKFVRIGEGKILVNATALTDYWKAYMEHERFSPTLRKMALALANISVGDERITIKDGNKEERLRYHSVDPKIISAWSEKNLVGDPQMLMTLMSGALLRKEVQAVIN